MQSPTEAARRQNRSEASASAPAPGYSLWPYGAKTSKPGLSEKWVARQILGKSPAPLQHDFDSWRGKAPVRD